MRAIIQRVSDATVTINRNVTAHIGAGLLVLLGIETSDTIDDIIWLAGKIVRLRIFEDPGHGMNRSVQDVDGDILIVSQFTLFASTKKGNRPSFSRAATSDAAVQLYETFLLRLAMDFGRPIHSGIFGANMQVSLVNDGPVTILIDSKNRE